jgi:hypothetical protein
MVSVGYQTGILTRINARLTLLQLQIFQEKIYELLGVFWAGGPLCLVEFD